jgi:hypothetical protein
VVRVVIRVVVMVRVVVGVVSAVVVVGAIGVMRTSAMSAVTTPVSATMSTAVMAATMMPAAMTAATSLGRGRHRPQQHPTADRHCQQGSRQEGHDRVSAFHCFLLFVSVALIPAKAANDQGHDFRTMA